MSKLNYWFTSGHADCLRPETGNRRFFTIGDVKLNTTIPPITDPLGQHWRQPPTSAILLDNTHAVMTEATFQQLAEYSYSFPSGVYPGKMWRRYDGLFDQRCAITDLQWLLMWFGECDDPTKCTNNSRRILIA
ncbi:hypothetical protein [Rugamonas sp. DEMB1]|uniref:hypothetical protein n=1 Tax=Rugamonas sp. DEMB1 TaxID=3039386 RepID=UPI002449E074|nr:hypothetical protein [Rugamonas sp. DEMB1]WGG51792.1 hypothetical protein QC826_06115 [Rugamonas sp. DEMB1]